MNARRFRKISQILLAILGLLLNACSSPGIRLGTTPLPTLITPAAVAGEAQVESVEVLLLESSPARVSVVARGHLPDSCTLLDQITQSRTSNTLQIKIATVRKSDAACAQTLVPFDKVITLDAANLAAGTYTVNVNGVISTFKLDTSNSQTSTPTPIAKTSSISGRVWHDLCAAGVEGQPAPSVSPAGCVADPRGGYRANGVLESGESGIGGVRVMLGMGACPAIGLTAATTDANGAYTFTSLSAGTYCISVNPTESPNVSVLVPGGWTFPALGQGSVTITLGDGDNKKDMNLGWDYQFLPPPKTANCLDRAAFIGDVTIPDNTTVVAGTSFVKTWRLRNDGTCIWGQGYSLVFVEGERLSGSATVPLGGETRPGNTVDVSVNMTAPAIAGRYRSAWKLLSASGIAFGVGRNGATPIYAQVAVGLPPVDKGSISGRVWHDVCAVGNGGPVGDCVPDGQGSYRANGVLEPGEPGIGRVVVALGVGACPSTGLDTAATNAAGVYSFPNLDAGTYCVSVDATQPTNTSVLLPGRWTAPAPDQDSLALTLAPRENKPNVNFGWDYQFLPPVVGACSYKATYVADVTIPDNTTLAPGASFVKTWRVRNDGTCTWGPGRALHTLAFIGGDKLGGPDSMEFPGQVSPGGVVDVSVSLKAPTLDGPYRSEWKLRTNDGTLVGVGPSGMNPLSVQIVVGTQHVPLPATRTRITFPPGNASTTFDTTLVSGASQGYVLRVLGGQELRVSATGNALVGVLDSGDIPLPVQRAGRPGLWTVQVPATSDYTVVVYGDGSSTVTIYVPPR